MSNPSIAEEVAQLLFLVEAVSIRPHNPFKYTSGILSPIYIDNRVIMSYPKVREKIIGFYMNIIKETVGIKSVDVISGTAHSAIPLAAWIADRLVVPLVFARSSPKDYGKQNKLEGVFEPGSNVLIIEDHISTGMSSLDNTRTIRELGGITNSCIATTSYGLEKATKAFEEAKVSLHVLTDFTTLVNVAIEQGRIKEEDRNLVMSWRSDPDNWIPDSRVNANIQ